MFSSFLMLFYRANQYFDIRQGKNSFDRLSTNADAAAPFAQLIIHFMIAAVRTLLMAPSANAMGLLAIAAIRVSCS